MKAHLAKLSLALLSTVFLLGCQEQGSGPVAPEGPQFDKASPTNPNCTVPDAKGHCHGDDKLSPEGPDVFVTMEGAVEAARQLATLNIDGQKLHVFTRGWVAELKLDEAGLSNCEIRSGTDAGLKAYLMQVLGPLEQGPPSSGMQFQS